MLTDYLDKFQNDRFIASVIRDAVEGSSCHHIPPSKTVGEALERLSESISEIQGYSHFQTTWYLKPHLDDLCLLETQIATSDTISYLNEVLGAVKRQELGDIGLCSDAMWGYLKALGYKDARPTPEIAKRLIGRLKKK